MLVPAGLEKSIGLITASYLKDINDPQWADSKDVKEYFAFMKKYNADADPKEYNNAYGYMQCNMLMQMLKQAGNDLTRENIMRQAASLKNVELPLLLPGIKVNTSPTDFYPIEQQMLAKFDGKEWKNFGELLDKQ